ncbi:MAG TPA: DinB family protein, partial [Terracidiphilus sp.]
PEVRTFGQLVGHVADASYNFCSQAIGEPNPSKDIEKTKTSKAALVAALKDGVAYCNKAFDSMNDAKGSEMVKLFNFNIAKLTLLSLNSAHTDEHYGNMVTYLRLKGIVPPTSENPPPQAPK